MVSRIKRIRQLGLTRAIQVLTGYWAKKDTTIIVRKDLSRINVVQAKLDVQYRWVEKAAIQEFMAAHGAFNASDVDDFVSRGARCLGAFVGPRLVGYVWIHYDYYRFLFFDHQIVLGPGEAFVGPAFVAPEYRGSRIYPALLTQSFRELAKEGFRVAYGNVGVTNTASIRGIVRAGFRPVKRITAVRLFRRFLAWKSEEPAEDMGGIWHEAQ